MSARELTVTVKLRWEVSELVLGGEITPSGQMDAILKDQNERDRFPRPMGGE